MAWLLAPWLVRTLAGNGIERWFAARHLGRLQVGRVELARLGRGARPALREIELVGPDGETILRGELELPPLGELFDLVLAELGGDSAAIELSPARAVVSGELVLAADGSTNLSRALQARSRPGSSVGVEDEESGDSSFARLGRAAFDVSLEVPRLAVIDERESAIGAARETFALSRFAAHVRAAAGGEWRLDCTGEVSAGRELPAGSLSAEFVAPRPTWERLDWPLGVVRGDVALAGVSSALVEGLLRAVAPDALPAQANLSELVGPVLDVSLDVLDVTPEGGRIEGMLLAERASARLRGRFAAGSFALEGADGLLFALSPPAELFAGLVANDLPPGHTLELLGGTQWTLNAPQLEFTLVDGRDGNGGVNLQRMVHGARLDATLELGAGLRWHGEGGPYTLHAPRVHARQLADGAFEASFEARIAGTQESVSLPLVATCAPIALWERVFGAGDASLFRAPLRLEVEELGGTNLSALVPAAAAVAELLGDDGRLTLLVDDLAAPRKRVSGAFTSEVARAEFDVATGAGVLCVAAGTDGRAPLTVDLSVSALERWLAPRLPSAASLSFPSDATVRLAVGELVVPATFLDESTALTARASVASCSYRAGPAAAAVTLDEVTVSATLPAAGALRFDVSAKAGDGAGPLTARVLGKQAWTELLRSPDRAAEAAFDVEVQAQDLPTTIVDGVLAGEGLFVDVLGPRLQLTLRGSDVTPRTGLLEAQLRSRLGTIDWRGRLEPGRIVSGAQERLDGRIALTPLFSRRIVGSLVPLLVDVSRDDATQPVLLDVSELAIPLDGNLAGLSGRVRLELGQVDYSLLPEFTRWLGDATRKKSTTIRPLVFAVENGLVRYEDVVLSIESHPYRITGSYDLARGLLALATEVPLENLGGDVAEELKRARERLGLDPQLAVPLTIAGSPSRPRIAVRDGFLGSLLEKASGDLLRKGLEKLLGER